MKIFLSCAIVGSIIFGCGRSKSSNSAKIAGTYASEYSIRIANPETGAFIGIRTIRDTISISTIGDQFEVSDNKWGKNDYDYEGWRSLKHSDDRPKLTFIGKLDDKAGTLSQADGLKLFIDAHNDEVYWNADIKYKRVSR